jgi:predicted DCC family thiol-disulfide oxidoreductase YuxK
MDAQEGQRRPVLYWDADCSFCRRWVERWKADSGDAVEYETLQEAPASVKTAAGGEPFQRIVLVRADGTMSTGAHAALEAQAGGGGEGRFLYWLYQSFPPFRYAAETGYRWIAAHRPACSALTQLFWGHDVLRPTYQISGYLFPRLIGLIFLFAFLSLWVQIDGLTGSQGILPVAAHLEAVRNHFNAAGSPHAAWLQVPSLLWFGSSDTMLHVWLGAGTLASLLLVLGIFPAVSALIAWLCYLSFAAAVPIFLNFQWDALLLEAGLLTVFYVPWRRYLAFGSSAPSWLGRILVWWLLFRLIFQSGMVKLFGYDAAGRNAWLDGTALDYHYFTQPIPVWTSWWFDALPGWFQLFSLVIVFTIELIAPFLILGPRRLRLTAFWAFTSLMVLIMLSGHYGFFNLLTLVLCVSLVDDASWPAWLRARLRPPDESRGRLALAENVHRKTLPVFAVLVVFLTTMQLLMVMRLVPPATVSMLLGPFAPWRSANSYGLFSVMTTERPEITIESSTDGRTWEPYRFRYKMDTNDNRLPFLIPHMPRLDWQMWFAALEYRASGQPPGWIMPLLGRLQERSTAVLGLLREDGGPSPAPAFFRLRLDLLTFTTPGARRETGNFWQAEALPAYTIEGSLQR